MLKKEYNIYLIIWRKEKKKKIEDNCEGSQKGGMKARGGRRTVMEVSTVESGHWEVVHGEMKASASTAQKLHNNWVQTHQLQEDEVERDQIPHFFYQLTLGWFSSSSSHGASLCFLLHIPPPSFFSVALSSLPSSLPQSRSFPSRFRRFLWQVQQDKKEIIPLIFILIPV